MKKNRKKLLSIYWRSFFIQSLWNYRSLISMGFCFSLIPIRRELNPSGRAFKEFVREHMQFFNSHPYFASFALGVLARLYEDDPDPSPEKVEKIKNLLISPLGALGDRLFWNMIKPTSMIIAVFFALLIYRFDLSPFFLMIPFLVYNVPHLYIRWKGIVEGYTYGIQIYHKLNFDTHKKLYKLYWEVGKLFLLLLGGSGLWLILESEGWDGLWFLLNIPAGWGLRYFNHHIYWYFTFLVALNVMLGTAIL